jgi:hypothetical protein
MAMVMSGGATWASGIVAVTDTQTPSDDSMPGLGSFIVFAFMAVALYFLLKNMNARLRRMSYREKEREAAERATREESESTTMPDLSLTADGRPGPAGDEVGRGESGAPHTDGADRNTEPPSSTEPPPDEPLTGERGGPGA